MIPGSSKNMSALRSNPLQCPFMPNHGLGAKPDANSLFCRAAGYPRYAGEGELVFGLTHYGRMMPGEDQGLKLEFLTVLARPGARTSGGGGWGMTAAGKPPPRFGDSARQRRAGTSAQGNRPGKPSRNANPPCKGGGIWFSSKGNAHRIGSHCGGEGPLEEALFILHP